MRRARRTTPSITPERPWVRVPGTAPRPPGARACSSTPACGRRAPQRAQVWQGDVHPPALPSHAHTTATATHHAGVTTSLPFCAAHSVFSVPRAAATTCVVRSQHCTSHTAPYASAMHHSGCPRGSMSTGNTLRIARHAHHPHQAHTTSAMSLCTRAVDRLLPELPAGLPAAASKPRSATGRACLHRPALPPPNRRLQPCRGEQADPTPHTRVRAARAPPPHTWKRRGRRRAAPCAARRAARCARPRAGSAARRAAPTAAGPAARGTAGR